MSSRTSRFHLVHITQLAPPQATPMDHYAAIQNTRPRLLTEGNYIITYHVHPDPRALDLNWIIEPENEIKFRRQDGEVERLLKREKIETSVSWMRKELVSVVALAALSIGSVFFGDGF